MCGREPATCVPQEEDVRAALDACLLTNEEMSLGPVVWAATFTGVLHEAIGRVCHAFCFSASSPFLFTLLQTLWRFQRARHRRL
jgi:hypothetical protein